MSSVCLHLMPNAIENQLTPFVTEQPCYSITVILLDTRQVERIQTPISIKFEFTHHYVNNIGDARELGCRWVVSQLLLIFSMGTSGLRLVLSPSMYELRLKHLHSAKKVKSWLLPWTSVTLKSNKPKTILSLARVLHHHLTSSLHTGWLQSYFLFCVRKYKGTINF